jgi:hypothetical protein
MPLPTHKTHEVVVAALAQNRGELDATRLAALLARLGPPAATKPAQAR